MRSKQSMVQPPLRSMVERLAIGSGGGGWTGPTSGQAVATLDGSNDYIEMSGSAGDIDANMSMAGWFELAASGQDGLISKGVNAQWGVDMNNGNLRLTNSSGTATANYVTQAGDRGRLVHVCATVDEGSDVSKLYIDGTEVATGTIGTLAAANGNLIRVGQFGTIWPYAGKTSDVRYYDKTLSAAEVQWLFDGSGTDPTETNLQGWWKLDEGTGTSVADSSGNGKTGTVVNSSDPPFWDNTF